MNEKPKYFNKLINNFLFSNLNGELLHNVKEIYDNQPHFNSDNNCLFIANNNLAYKLTYRSQAFSTNYPIENEEGLKKHNDIHEWNNLYFKQRYNVIDLFLLFLSHSNTNDRIILNNSHKFLEKLKKELGLITFATSENSDKMEKMLSYYITACEVIINVIENKYSSISDEIYEGVYKVIKSVMTINLKDAYNIDSMAMLFFCVLVKYTSLTKINKIHLYLNAIEESCVYYLKGFDYYINNGIVDIDYINLLLSLKEKIKDRDNFVYLHIILKVCYVLYLLPLSLPDDIISKKTILLSELSQILNLHRKFLPLGIDINRYKHALYVYSDLFKPHKNIKSESSVHEYNSMISNKKITDDIVLININKIEHLIFPLSELINAYIMLYNYIIQEGEWSALKEKAFNVIHLSIILYKYSDKMNTLSNLKLFQRIIVNIFKYKLLTLKKLIILNKKAKDFCTLNGIHLEIIEVIKKFKHINLIISFNDEFAKEIYQLYISEADSYFNLGLYKKAKKKYKNIDKHISYRNKKEIKEKIIACYFKMGKMTDKYKSLIKSIII